MLALGDLKAFLSKLLGTERLTEIMTGAQVPQVVNSHQADGVRIDPYRTAIWGALRELYPTKVSTKTLKGEPLGEKESAASYVEAQLRRWRVLTDNQVEANQVLTELFRKSIIEGLPDDARVELEEKVGLTAKSHTKFMEYLTNAVEKSRRDAKKQDDQLKDLQRKLLQVQLEEIKRKEREKKEDKVKPKEGEKLEKMAPVMADFIFEEISPVTPRGPPGGVPQPTIVDNISGLPPTAFSSAQQGPPIWKQNNQGGGRQNQGNVRGQGGKQGGKYQGQQRPPQGTHLVSAGSVGTQVTYKGTASGRAHPCTHQNSIGQDSPQSRHTTHSRGHHK